MRRTTLDGVFFGILLLVSVQAAGASAPHPVAVSPGSPTGSMIGDTCPTFSWGSVAGARSYELVVYRLGDGGEEAEPVLRQSFAGSVSSWTPSLARCLERGGQYAWTVRATGENANTGWSAPSLFEVASGPSEVEFEQALALVQRYLEQHDGPPDRAPEPESGGPLSGATPPATSAAASRVAVEAEASTAGPSVLALEPPVIPTVSLVTEGALVVGTATPLADVHVVGRPAIGSLLLAPDEPSANQSSEILLAEDDDGTYGMVIRYDGQISNTLEIWGRFQRWESGPWLTIHRDTGTTTFRGPLVGIDPDPPCYSDTHRFVSCGNGTVTDTATGLIWLEDADCFERMLYQSANEAAAAFWDGATGYPGDGDCGLTDGSRPGDWRLATAEEFKALFNEDCEDPPEIMGNGTADAEVNCYSEYPWAGPLRSSYWTMETVPWVPDKARTANVNVASIGSHVKWVESAVWPVRGPMRGGE
ncbi:MAG: DUF1566 domain-containing protein [bacterium]|nr:DUF1566 domain-containing protein [bacterium]